MKPRKSPVKHPVALALLVSMVLAPALPAQQASPAPGEDPTGLSMPPASFGIEPVKQGAKYDPLSPVLIISSFLLAAGGTTLFFVSGSVKPEYDQAYAAWEAAPNAFTLTERDLIGARFFIPLLSGAGLSIGGIILFVAGVDLGDGSKNLRVVAPQETWNQGASASQP